MAVGLSGSLLEYTDAIARIGWRLDEGGHENRQALGIQSGHGFRLGRFWLSFDWSRLDPLGDRTPDRMYPFTHRARCRRRLQAPAAASAAARTWLGEEDQMDEIGWPVGPLGRDSGHEVLARQEGQQRRQAGVYTA
jgi:hypothetical protein